MVAAVWLQAASSAASAAGDGTIVDERLLVGLLGAAAVVAGALLALMAVIVGTRMKSKADIRQWERDRTKEAYDSFLSSVAEWSHLVGQISNDLRPRRRTSAPPGLKCEQIEPGLS